MTQEELDYVESRQRQHHETIRYQSDIAYHVGKEEMLMFSLLNPKIFIDGKEWCVLYGDNLQVGIAGFGTTPYEAILNFNKQWHTKLSKKRK